MSTPEKLVALREKYGLTQTQAAEMLNMAHRHYIRYEKGLHKIRPLYYELLCIKAAAYVDVDLQQKLKTILKNC